jgi:hypothetical protein
VGEVLEPLATNPLKLSVLDKSGLLPCIARTGNYLTWRIVSSKMLVIE